MTTDQKDHIAFIRESPDDDAPRLVYADWLQERNTNPFLCDTCNGVGRVMVSRLPNGKYAPTSHFDSFGLTAVAHTECPICFGKGQLPGNGFAERAEFIRGQIADKHGGQYTSDVSLARRNRPHAGIPNAIWFNGSWGIQIRRGFIEWLHFDWSSCLAHLDAILEEHPLRRVRLTDQPNELPYKKDGEVGIVRRTRKDGSLLFEGEFKWRSQRIPLGYLFEGTPFDTRFCEAFRGRWPGVEVELPPMPPIVFPEDRRRMSLLLDGEYLEDASGNQIDPERISAGPTGAPTEENEIDVSNVR